MDGHIRIGDDTRVNSTGHSDNDCTASEPCATSTCGATAPASPATLRRRGGTVDTGRTLTSGSPVKLRRDLSLLLAGLFVLLLGVTSACAYDSEIGCSAGQPHQRFKECSCGQYAVSVLTETGAAEYRLMGIEVHYRHSRFYVCTKCTTCGDGIRVDRQCSENKDTKCSDAACVDPTWRFDFGMKACLPVPTLEPTTTMRRAPVELVFNDPTPPGGVYRQPSETGTSEWVLRHLDTVIIVIMCFVAVLIIAVCIMVFAFVHIYRRLNDPVVSKSPYSSQNTSSSTVAPV